MQNWLLANFFYFIYYHHFFNKYFLFGRIFKVDIAYFSKMIAIYSILFYYKDMRIISGKYKGKKLKEFNLDTTRPTTDRVKESIFNLIQFDIVDSVVLDLFAGTGALGIEAISRGAQLTHLVDANKNAVKIINENLKTIEGNYKVFNMDYKTYIEQENFKYDIVFLDPPYKTDFGLNAINLLIKNNRLAKESIVIFETSEQMEFNFPHCFDVAKKKYGTVAVYKLVYKD